MRTTDDPAHCVSPKCRGRKTDSHAHGSCGGDPNVCDHEGDVQTDHNQALLYIRQIESLHRRLKISFGVTQRLREQTTGAKPVDPHMPCPTRCRLEKMSKTINELRLGDEK